MEYIKTFEIFNLIKEDFLVCTGDKIDDFIKDIKKKS